jgi:antitoxin component YwqK of YwqJK toxin-antitoxin module
MKNFEFNGKNEGLYIGDGFEDIIFDNTEYEYRKIISNKMICYYKNGKLHGKIFEYYKNGNISLEGYYKNDREEGIFIEYYKYGANIKYNYVNGMIKLDFMNHNVE